MEPQLIVRCQFPFCLQCRTHKHLRKWSRTSCTLGSLACSLVSYLSLLSVEHFPFRLRSMLQQPLKPWSPSLLESAAMERLQLSFLFFVRFSLADFANFYIRNCFQTPVQLRASNYDFCLGSCHPLRPTEVY